MRWPRRHLLAIARRSASLATYTVTSASRSTTSPVMREATGAHHRHHVMPGDDRNPDRVLESAGRCHGGVPICAVTNYFDLKK